jgi:myo-inositol-1(or 4)-monophosphatase
MQGGENGGRPRAGQTPLTSKELTSRFDAARSVAAEAGRLARSFLAKPQRLQIASKGPQDVITAADLAVECLIVQNLTRMFPDDSFLAEETYTETSSETLRGLWVIDPIDGTGNFAGGRSDWCVSIGFMHLGEPVIGVIDVPSMHEQYAALRGGGATRNGEPVRASDCGSLAQSTLDVDFSFRHSSAAYLEILQALFDKEAGFRCNGSSAVSLAHVACGRLDGFVELHVYPWDVMAGIVLIQEAGGWVSDFLAQGGLRRGGPMIAAAAGIRTELTALLGKIVGKAWG